MKGTHKKGPRAFLSLLGRRFANGSKSIRPIFGRL